MFSTVLLSLSLAVSDAPPTAPPAAQAFPLPEAAPVVADVLPDTDPVIAIQGRARTVRELIPHLEVEEVPTTAETCLADAHRIQEGFPLQMFVLRQPDSTSGRPLSPALLPLRYDVALRDSVDIDRLAPLCRQVSAFLVVSVNEAWRQDNVATHTVALQMADWAQRRADGGIRADWSYPQDVGLDPFGVVSRYIEAARTATR